MRLLSAIGVLLITISAFLVWISSPIAGGVNTGIKLGWIAIFIGTIGLAAWFYKSKRLLTVCWAGGLCLCSFYILYLTFWNPAFWQLIDENSQYANIMNFSQRFLPANYGIEPTFEKVLFTETVLERLITSIYFMSWGWWICIAGSLMLLIVYLKTNGWKAIKWIAITVVVIFAFQGIIFFKGFASQYFQDKGDRLVAKGRYADAIQKYDMAKYLDPQIARNEQIYLKIGAAYFKLGKSSYSEALFYHGYINSQEEKFDASISEYLIAAEKSSAQLKDIIHRQLAWSFAKQGITQYRKGLVGSAIGSWERALSFDPNQFQAIYFLTRAYYENGRYKQSIDTARLLLSKSRNNLLNANLQSNIGDSYWKLGDFKAARSAYEASMVLDYYANLRIFKSLGGT
jgi:tetratricopeptide (TPR) repeat protein